jgi:hypothetical protein
VASRESWNDDREVDREGERYREAAEHALDQLEWCFDYLYRVRKPDIARAQPVADHEAHPVGRAYAGRYRAGSAERAATCLSSRRRTPSPTSSPTIR